LLFATYIGGSSNDQHALLAVDGSGNPHVTMWTQSTDLVTTPGCPQPTYGFGYLIKLDASGTTPIFASYLGTDGRILALALDHTGSSYVAGYTQDLLFPTTPTAYCTSYQGGTDAFVMKVDTVSNAIVYSTLLGGSAAEYCVGLAVDSSGNAVISGQVGSSNFPVTLGAFMTNYTSYNGSDGFLTKFDATGSSLVFSTFMIGAYPATVACDAVGDIYTSGRAPAFFPTTPGAFLPTTSQGGMHAAKFRSDGSLAYSTFIWEPPYEFPYATTVDSAGNLVFVGSFFTGVHAIPVTSDALQPASAGGSAESFYGKLNATGTGMIYCSFLGGSKSDGIAGVCMGAQDSVYLCGSTDSADFPVTPGAYDPVVNPKGDAFLMKLDLPMTPAGSSLYGAGTPGCLGLQRLTINKTAKIGATGFAWACDNAPWQALGLLLISDSPDAPGSDALGLGVMFHIDLQSAALWGMDMNSSTYGVGLTPPFAIPNNPNLIGQTFYSQAFWLWPASTCALPPWNLSSSNGVAITILQ
jgi:hypothetical protein